jgi:hypothetical protein
MQGESTSCSDNADDYCIERKGNDTTRTAQVPAADAMLASPGKARLPPGGPADLTSMETDMPTNCRNIFVQHCNGTTSGAAESKPPANCPATAPGVAPAGLAETSPAKPSPAANVPAGRVCANAASRGTNGATAAGSRSMRRPPIGGPKPSTSSAPPRPADTSKSATSPAARLPQNGATAKRATGRRPSDGSTVAAGSPNEAPDESSEKERPQDTSELVKVVTGRADAAAVPEDDVQRQLRKVLHAADELTPVAIHGEIGRGAFGVVYKGVQCSYRVPHQVDVQGEVAG